MLQDIARDVRETKVHYSPSEKDGVFVVEVARGADSINSTPIMANMGGAAASMAAREREQMNTVSPRQTQATIIEVAEDHQPKSVDYASSNDGNAPSCTRSNEKVLVHQPPNGMEEDVLMIDEDGAVSMASPKHNGISALEGACGGVAIADSGNSVNTGLSQSDLSVSSSGGSNRYCYGQQEAYTVAVKAHEPAAVTPNNGIAPIALVEQMELMDQIDSIEPEPIDTNLGIPTPEPITVISDDTEHESQINENGSPEHALDNNSTFKPEHIQTNLDAINENQISTTAASNGCILASKALPKMNAENGNENGNIDANSNGNDPQLYERHHQQNGFKSQSITASNGKPLNGDLKNGFNGNEHLMDDSSDFDSLMNLPAPPSCDEIKQFNDITTLDNGNMDSLPPPPPEIIPAATAAGPINVGS